MRRGRVSVDTVAPPQLRDGHVLVRVAYSFVSTGTEIAGLKSSRSPSLVRQAVQSPAKVGKLAQHVQQKGIPKTFSKLRGELDPASSPGYSCSGRVLRVGPGITTVVQGQRVACGGAGLASHAEQVVVPKNLVVPVPDGVRLLDASSVALGAIALQSIRRAAPQLGETIVVLGLGLLGQLTSMMLHACGCRVIGVDLDPRRVDIARSLSPLTGLSGSGSRWTARVRQLTDGHGADAVIIAAHSSSDEVVNRAMEVTRERGRVVVMGAVGLGVRREHFYRKEIDLLISRSYGPGRYDPLYEERGIDYPFGYVRWTEQRNMSEYLRLIGAGAVDLSVLVERVVSVDDAATAYAELEAAGPRPLGVVLRYEDPAPARSEQPVPPRTTRPHTSGAPLRVAVVGAGGFAQAVHLPNLRRLRKLASLRAVVSSRGANADNVARLFDADYATTDLEHVLDDDDVDAVMICTRHDLHAQQALRAIRAGKAVFVEKPMALDRRELDALDEGIRDRPVPFLVGFNRRFSPALVRAHELMRRRRGPFLIHYRVNAGAVPPEHWVQGPEGGGRLVGEACHMLDVFQYLAQPQRALDLVTTLTPTRRDHGSDPDNAVATLRYPDGSSATLLYTSLGNTQLGKEAIEVFFDGLSIVVKDFLELRCLGWDHADWSAPHQDKGHLAMLQLFLRHCLGEVPAPIAVDDLFETTRWSFLLGESDG